MAVKYLAGNRLWGTDAERLAMSGGTLDVPQTTWKELDQAVASGGSTTELEVTFTAKDYLMFLIHATATTTASLVMNFGGSDYTETDYNVSRVFNGPDNSQNNSTTTSWRVVQVSSGNTDGSGFGVFQVWNDANSGFKLGSGHYNMTEDSGASDSCNSYETVAVWSPDSASTRITRAKISGATIADGTEFTVLGMDREGADGGGTTNFWQEIATVSGDGSSLTMTTGSMTLPKYLMVDIWAEDMVGAKMYFNGETSATDFQRTYSRNGTDPEFDGAGAGLAFIGDLAPASIELYIVNKAGYEKLIIGHDTETKDTTDTVERMELWCKNTDTDIINKIQLTKTGSNWTANDNITIWGHD